MELKTDSELVELARGGDKEAFGELIERYMPMACRITRRMMHDPELGRELAQEAMLEAFLSLGHLRDTARFKSWLYGIVLNVCRSYLRSQKAEYFSLDSLAGGLRFEAIDYTGPVLDPAQVAEQRELHQTVLQTVNFLSPRNRAATLMFYYEQLSMPEIAAILGVSVTAVKGRLHKSRQQLRQRLMAELDYLSTEPVQPENRRRTMVKVTIADVVPQERETGGKTHTHYAVVLLDEVGRRAVPIWVGKFEGEAIALGLREIEVPRPLTFTFMAKLLEASGAALQEIRIEALKDDTFYAVAKLRIGDKSQEIDARPSDALALAVRTGSPIYASEEVLAKAGLAIPETVNLATPGKGLDGLQEKIEGELAAFRTGPNRFKRLTEELNKTGEELISFVFGGLN